MEKYLDKGHSRQRGRLGEVTVVQEQGGQGGGGSRRAIDEITFIAEYGSDVA